MATRYRVVYVSKGERSVLLQGFKRAEPAHRAAEELRAVGVDASAEAYSIAPTGSQPVVPLLGRAVALVLGLVLSLGAVACDGTDPYAHAVPGTSQPAAVTPVALDDHQTAQATTLIRASALLHELEAVHARARGVR